jgi:hypothetical protein
MVFSCQEMIRSSTSISFRSEAVGEAWPLAGPSAGRLQCGGRPANCCRSSSRSMTLPCTSSEICVATRPWAFACRNSRARSALSPPSASRPKLPRNTAAGVSPAPSVCPAGQWRVLRSPRPEVIDLNPASNSRPGMPASQQASIPRGHQPCRRFWSSPPARASSGHSSLALQAPPAVRSIHAAPDAPIAWPRRRSGRAPLRSAHPDTLHGCSSARFTR